MGCYNTVTVNCPDCDTIVEFQSKSGSCNFKYNHISHMPEDDLPGIKGDIEPCPECGFRVAIVASENYIDASHLVC